MIKTLSQQMAKYYNGKLIIKDDELEIYAYGFELLISTILNLSCVLIVSCLFKKFFEALLFLSTFVPLRLSAGGYHAKYHCTCILGFNIIFISFLAFLQVANTNDLRIYSLISMTIASFFIWRFAPTEAINKPLDKQQYQHQRKRSIALTSINLIGTYICYFIPKVPATLLACFSSGALSVAVLLIAAKINTLLKKSF